ncbi:MAG: transcriptional regulator [Verrucomicrobia bacterium]|nr:transcriptional regulator [Verrucomicrobiota bacterium]
MSTTPSISAGQTAPVTPSPQLTPFEAQVVEVFTDLVQLLGLPKSVGEIYGLLFATAEPLVFAEIERKLDLSKGSVSQGLRTLRELGAIIPADPELDLGGTHSGLETPRATRWVAVVELRRLLGSLLRERLVPYIKRQDQRMLAATQSLIAAEPDLTSASLKILQSRLSKLETWQARASTVLPLIGKML